MSKRFVNDKVIKLKNHNFNKTKENNEEIEKLEKILIKLVNIEKITDGIIAHGFKDSDIDPKEIFKVKEFNSFKSVMLFVLHNNRSEGDLISKTNKIMDLTNDYDDWKGSSYYYFKNRYYKHYNVWCLLEKQIGLEKLYLELLKQLTNKIKTLKEKTNN